MSVNSTPTTAVNKKAKAKVVIKIEFAEQFQKNLIQQKLLLYTVERLELELRVLRENLPILDFTYEEPTTEM